MNVQTIARKPESAKIVVAPPKATAPKSASADRTEEWLMAQIQKGKNEPFCEIVTLTPALAAALLARNDDNRPFSKLNFERISADLENGRAQFNGESIIISDDGRLNDGQHRCSAVRESGKPLRTVIVFGVPRLSRMTVDTGNARTVGNFLGMQCIEDSNALATVAQYVWLYREYNTLRSVRGGTKLNARLRRPTKAEILSVAASFPDIEANLLATKTSAPGGRTLNAFCRWAIARKAGDAAAAVFFEQLATGASLKPNSPVLFAREKLLGDVKRYYPHERAQLILKAWNMCRQDQVITKFERSGREVTNGIRVDSLVLPAIEV